MTAPYKSGHWQADSKHSLYWELYGNPEGKPVIILHGGPGGGRDTYLADYFDPENYKILMFDQRGCGLSQPAGCLEDNNTAHLIEDIENLRLHLNLGPSFIVGGSWGATLALEYAKAFTTSCAGLILYSVFLGRPQDEDWFINGTSRFYPDYHATLTTLLSPAERKDIIKSYKARVNSNDDSIVRTAASAFLNYMTILLPLRCEDKILTTPESITRKDIDAVRIFLHFSINNYFLKADGALDNIQIIAQIPGTILQGRYDMDTPPQAAWELLQSWPTATLEFIPACGHSDTEPPMKAALIKAFKKTSD